MRDLTTHASIEDLVRKLGSDRPVVCYFPQRARAAARQFAQGFPGEVLYAVKANPEPGLLHWFTQGGVTGFDTASIPEIAMVRTELGAAACYYNHPIKPRRAIVEAYRSYGVRHFVIDHVSELDKILEEVGSDLTLQVRVRADNPHARVNFGSKFGASHEEAVELLRAVRARGAEPAMSMHVGYQTTEPQAFADGIGRAAAAIEASGVAIRYLNVGGGFPSVLRRPDTKLEDFFAAIGGACAGHAVLRGVPLKCEPGSALAHPSAALLAQVLAVKGERLYLNDGVYGAMSELLHTRIQPPCTVYAPTAERRSGAPRPYTVFGPTCDSYDTIPARFDLPGDLREGDWILMESMGAYSVATMSDFNGLGAHAVAVVGD